MLIAIFRRQLIKVYVFLVTCLELASIKKRIMAIPRMTAAMPASFGILCLALFIAGLCTSWHNKAAFHKLMTGKTIGEVEHTLTEKDHAVLYLPIYRLDFSIYANQLAAHQITQLIRAAHSVKVDSCSYRSPNIVLIIGESFGRHHSQQYGYFMETTPRQVALEKTRKLTKFSDVVTCWNLTSFVFKNMLSTMWWARRENGATIHSSLRYSARRATTSPSSPTSSCHKPRRLSMTSAAVSSSTTQN